MRGFYNSGPTTGIACAQVAFKCVTSPTDYPMNDGSFRNLKVVSAARQHRQRGTPGADALVDDISDDGGRHHLQGARPKQFPIRSSPATTPIFAWRCSTAFYADSKQLFITSFGPLGGGWGAKRSEDGVSATVCINDGDTHNSPNEQLEAKFPLLVERHALIRIPAVPVVTAAAWG